MKIEKSMKWRAWVKKEKIMDYVKMIDLRGKKVWLENLKGTRDFKDVIILFPTGLYDRNGIHIYEGDVLRLYAQENGKVFVHDIGIVVYRREKTGWSGFAVKSLVEKGCYHFSYWANINCEVIGNYYADRKLVRKAIKEFLKKEEQK
jgi:uncharacterized phage protein (TIGR01671 family)